MKNSNFIDLPATLKELAYLVGDGDNVEYTRGALEIVAAFVTFSSDNTHADNVMDLAETIGLSDKVIQALYNVPVTVRKPTSNKQRN